LESIGGELPTFEYQGDRGDWSTVDTGPQWTLLEYSNQSKPSQAN